MSTRQRVSSLTAALITFATTTALAGPPSTKPPHPTKPVSHPTKPTSHPTKPITPAAMKAPKPTSPHAVSTPKATGPKSTKVTTKNATTAGTTKHSTTASSTTVTTPVTSTSPNLPKNQKLVTRLALLLPPGTDMNVAAGGFKNQGQFVAAVHVSNNLGISFVELKHQMVDEGLSLGQAIQTFPKNVNAEAEASRATQQAQQDLTSVTQTTTSPTSKKPKNSKGHSS